MAYELEQPWVGTRKRVDIMCLKDHELRSIKDIKRIYDRGLYTGKEMLSDHMEYLQSLMKRCTNAMKTEKDEGYSNPEDIIKEGKMKQVQEQRAKGAAEGKKGGPGKMMWIIILLILAGVIYYLYTNGSLSAFGLG